MMMGTTEKSEQGETGAGAFLTSLKADGGADLIGGVPGSGETVRSSKFASIGIVVLVLAVAAGALFVMRKFGMGANIDLANIKIDYQFGQKETVVTADHDRILSDLQSSREIRQVPLEEIQMNPFAWNMRSRVTEDVVDTEALRRERERIEAEERRRTVQNAFDRLKLRSVVGGSHPMAQISGRMVRVGDEVGEFFTVTAIEGRSVELLADGQTFIMSLGEP